MRGDNEHGRNPVGVVDGRRRVPRVARSSQLWAGTRNPVGIGNPCKEQDDSPLSKCVVLLPLGWPQWVAPSHVPARLPKEP